MVLNGLAAPNAPATRQPAKAKSERMPAIRRGMAYGASSAPARLLLKRRPEDSVSSRLRLRPRTQCPGKHSEETGSLLLGGRLYRAGNARLQPHGQPCDTDARSATGMADQEWCPLPHRPADRWIQRQVSRVTQFEPQEVVHDLRDALEHRPCLPSAAHLVHHKADRPPVVR